VDFETRPRRRDSILAQEAGDTVILLTPVSGEYFTLNEVGARIWQLADGTLSVSDIARVLADEYDAPFEDIRTDALDVLGELQSADLLDGGGR
jgi:hypothetical protein